jgi:Tfp pilus assembly major pilin PilA
MFKKILSISLVIVLLQIAGVVSALAGPKVDDTARVAKVRQEISRLGTGPEARIKLKLKDKTELAGYVEEAGQETLTVKNKATGESTTVQYADVQKAKGNNLSKGATIAIGAAAGVGAALLILLMIYASNER